MLRIINVDPVISDLVAIGKNSTIDGTGNNRVNGVKVGTKTAISKT